MSYRASKYVRLGTPDEHAYNMYLSVMHMCERLGLWKEPVGWRHIFSSFERLTGAMRPIGRKKMDTLTKIVHGAK